MSDTPAKTPTPANQSVRKSSRSSLSKILAGGVVVIVLAVIFLRGDQLVELADTVRRGAPLFLALAVASQLGKYFAQGWAYIYCFRAVSEGFRFRDSIKLVFGTFFMNTVAPSLNLAGMTLVVDDAAKRGIPAGRATSAALLMQVTIDTGFVVIMLIGFGLLSVTVGLQPGWLLVGLLAVLLVSVLVTVMVVGGKRPELVIRVLTPFERLADRVLRKFKKGPIDGWADRTVRSFSEASGLIVQNPKKTAAAFGFSILASTFELGCFALTGVAFGVQAIEPLICGYVVATLFAMISFTPQGVGVVEAAVLVAFTLFGISQAMGIAVIMVYRGIVFWLPFLIGAILIQRTKAFQAKGVSYKRPSPAQERAAAQDAEGAKGAADAEVAASPALGPRAADADAPAPRSQPDEGPAPGV